MAHVLLYLLGYTKWGNFVGVVSKAKSDCELSDQKSADYFADFGKTILMQNGATKDVPEVILTSYACYIIAQNGDQKKSEIAFD